MGVGWAGTAGFFPSEKLCRSQGARSLWGGGPLPTTPALKPLSHFSKSLGSSQEQSPPERGQGFQEVGDAGGGGIGPPPVRPHQLLPGTALRPWAHCTRSPLPACHSPMAGLGLSPAGEEKSQQAQADMRGTRKGGPSSMAGPQVVAQVLKGGTPLNTHAVGGAHGRKGPMLSHRHSWRRGHPPTALGSWGSLSLGSPSLRTDLDSHAPDRQGQLSTVALAGCRLHRDCLESWKDQHSVRESRAFPQAHPRGPPVSVCLPVCVPMCVPSCAHTQAVTGMVSSPSQGPLLLFLSCTCLLLPPGSLMLPGELNSTRGFLPCVKKASLSTALSWSQPCGQEQATSTHLGHGPDEEPGGNPQPCSCSLPRPLDCRLPAQTRVTACALCSHSGVSFVHSLCRHMLEASLTSAKEQGVQRTQVIARQREHDQHLRCQSPEGEPSQELTPQLSPEAKNRGGLAWGRGTWGHGQTKGSQCGRASGPGGHRAGAVEDEEGLTCKKGQRQDGSQEPSRSRCSQTPVLGDRLGFQAQRVRPVSQTPKFPQLARVTHQPQESVVPVISTVTEGFSTQLKEETQRTDQTAARRVTTHTEYCPRGSSWCLYCCGTHWGLTSFCPCGWLSFRPSRSQRSEMTRAFPKPRAQVALWAIRWARPPATKTLPLGRPLWGPEIPPQESRPGPDLSEQS
ncbi:hypothetical protein Cadr_000019970 [Camelus dromedarius]|uniref:Uncharacterized protein n=1 Tax=Camelus dromedarius TaxID=9838 RepID=A0A5N4D2E7_CAMDR|nr:hypothetical protein Cadr_000019970 [Camelus dromedarius]